jgi:SsrA-binding protein
MMPAFVPSCFSAPMPLSLPAFLPYYRFMSKGSKSNSKAGTHEPTIENRKARHEYHILDTLECGIKLVGTEVKSVRAGQVSLAEGFVRASDSPLRLSLHGVHIAEYPPAGESFQHAPTRTRTLLAQKREILKLVDKTREPGVTLIPLKVYFVRGMAKVLIGLAKGKGKSDKRQDIAKREARRDIERAMSRRR